MHRGALVRLGSHLYRTAMSFHDVHDDDQSQAGALTFGGEVRIKNAAEQFGGDAGAVIHHVEHNVVFVGGQTQQQNSAVLHGLHGVQAHVKHSLAQTVGVDPGENRSPFAPQLHAALARILGQQPQNVVHQAAHVGRGGMDAVSYTHLTLPTNREV